jgi:2-oxoglutarate ferredoxin oxidoreductase subunit alpha
MSQRKVLQGNIIVAKAALAANDFFAGYPSPSSEIARICQGMQNGATFIRWRMNRFAGRLHRRISNRKKSMTATAAGLSLMQEHIGMAVMAEVPVVIVNVMRGGPSTGMPTKPAQADMMQARWGTHGYHPIMFVPLFPRKFQ